jgi:hypothetical protein
MKLNAITGVGILCFAVACAPTSQPPAPTQTTAKPTTAPATSAETRGQRAFEKAPLRKGELWTLNIASADGKTKRTYPIEITGTLEYDDKNTEVYASAKSGKFDATTFYDPNTQQQGVAVYLDKANDPNIAWCDFNEATRGVTRMSGVSFIGTLNQLNRLLKAGSSTGFGKCIFEKTR